MRHARRGFTLFEVLLALLLITVGLLGLLGTLGPITRLSGEGRLLGRMAQIFESRLDLLRAELLRGAPACAPPIGGSQQHPEGVSEAWSATARAGLIELSLIARSASGSDTLLIRLPCP